MTTTETKKATVEYQYDLGKVDGKVAYIIRFKGNCIGKSKNEKGIKGQIFLDRGETIEDFKERGYKIEFIN